MSRHKLTGYLLIFPQMRIDLPNLMTDQLIQLIFFAHLPPEGKHNIPGYRKYYNDTEPGKFVRHTAVIIGQSHDGKNPCNLQKNIKGRRKLTQKKRQDQYDRKLKCYQQSHYTGPQKTAQAVLHPALQSL